MNDAIVRGSTADALVFGPVVLSSDHISPAMGLTFGVLVISKNAGAFAAPSGLVSEIGNGFYSLPAASGASNYSTPGPLILHAEASSADPLDQIYNIVPSLFGVPITQHSGTYPIVVLLVDSSDHVTGAAGRTVTISLSKDGGPYSPASGPVSEIGGSGNGFGWYATAPDATDTDTAGLLAAHAGASGCDPSDAELFVQAVAASGGTPPDLMAAVVAQLRSTPGVVLALGEDTTTQGLTKIWADGLAYLPSLPYLTYEETTENVQGTTGSPYVVMGTFRIEIFHAEKLPCRDLGTLVKGSLDDTPLTIADGTVQYLRHNIARFETVSNTGVGSSTVHKMIIDFDYMLTKAFAF